VFRFIVAVLAVIGVVALVTGGVGAAAVGAGLLVFPLLILAKIAFLMVLFGVFGRMFWHRSRRFGDGSYPEWGWGRGPRARRPEAPRKSPEQSFEEWHRMAHAREEVDSWAPPIPDDDNA
jgi:hypothetical protein